MKSAPTYITLLLFLFAFSVSSNAQVTGKVVDSANVALSFCNVMLVKATDSTVVTGTTADEAGRFSLEKKENGSFRVLLMYSGYAQKYSGVFELTDAHPVFDLGVVSLQADAAMLDAVQIVAQKPFMEQKLDRVVFNIETSVLAAGNNALDVLRKLPGVTVDNNDNIQVRGKSGVQFMIDGRTSYMSGPDMANYLRGIDASQIERIEVITNPSAKYDASGNAIINIVMRKNKNLGFNGQLVTDYDQGFYGGGSGGVNVNYRMKKWNFFAAEHLGQWAFYDKSTRIMNYGVGTPQHSVIESESWRKMGGKWSYTRAGIDFFPTEKHTVGLVFEHSGGTRDFYRTYNSMMFDGNSNLDSSQFTSGPDGGDNLYYSGDLNYKFDIDTTGKVLTADINYASFSNEGVRVNTTNYYNSFGIGTHIPTIQKSVLPLKVSILAGQVDYVHPIEGDKLFETGVKGSYVSTDNDAHYFNVVQGVEINDTTLSNHFLYAEYIFSGYVNYSQKINDKIDLQIGLRGEQTESEGKQLTDSSFFTRSYFKLFPSAFLNWAFDSTNTFNVSYSRRIDRPDYGELNPFVFFSDPNNSFSGNPYLKPQMSDNFEVTHIFMQNYRTSLSYMHMTEVFTPIASQNDSTHVFSSKTENLATYNVFSLSFSAMIPVTNWYMLSGTVFGFRDHYFGPVNGLEYSVVNWTYIVMLQNTVSLKKDWNIEANLFYRSLNLNGVLREAPVSGLDIGIRKKFAKGKASVSVMCSDVFWMTYQNSTSAYGNVNYSVNGKNDSRRLRVSLSWKFGRSQFEREERRQSAEDERNRAQ